MSSEKYRTCVLVAAMALSLATDRADIAGPFPDTLLSMPTSAENIAAGLEADAYATGLSAYIWGYPLVRMERVAREYTDVPSPKPPTSYCAPLNQIGWATSLATPAAK